MKLGTKLLAVILPPLIVLVIVAGIGAQDRLVDAADARSADQQIELAAAASGVATTLQWERNLSLYVLAGGEDGTEVLAQRQAMTDQRWEAFTAIAEEVRGTDEGALDSLIDEAAAHESRIASFRQSIAADATDVWIVRRAFDIAISDHIDLIGEVSNTIPVVEVSSDLASYSALAQAKEATSQIGAAILVAITEGEFDPPGRLWRSMMEARESFARYESLFFDQSPVELQSDLRGAINSGDAQAATRVESDIINDVAPSLNWLVDGSALGETVSLDGYDAGRWLDLIEARTAAMGGVGDNILNDVSTFVSDARTEAEQGALLFLLVTAAAVLFSGILAVVVARRVTKPLRELTDAADRLSGEQIPALVERLRNPKEGSGGVILEPIGMKRSDEIGHLADAFDAIQRVTVEVAEEQANLLRKGIGDIFVNLARRNQTLLDRQIEFIDQLESSEEDPDVLENLFKLDHLATRMRRNAESLLVLAGIETGHRRSKPVPLPDVVRVAIGEVEDFARLNLLSLDDALVTGTAAMDVAHLLSELMENATSFSPPETNVEILGHQSPDGYVISISDQGIGMSEEQFAEANRLLADPPLVGLTLSRSLGFTVVGRLASRFNINVRLTSSPTGGVTALVTLPEAILQPAPAIEVQPEPASQTPAEPEATPEPIGRAFADPLPEPEATPEPMGRAFADPVPEPEPNAETVGRPEPFEPSPVFEREPDFQRPSDPAPDWVTPAPATSSLASAVPEGEAFDAGLAALMGEERGASTETDDPGTDRDDITPTAPAQDRAEAPSQAPEAPAPSLFGGAPMTGDESSSNTAPTEGGVTSAGLVRRVPRANAPIDEQVERPGSSTSVAASQRSPEEVRAMLSRYRSGLQRANRGDGQGSGDYGSDASN